MSSDWTPVGRRWLAAILALALILRLAFAFSQSPLAAYQGDDPRWYLMNGYALVTGFEVGTLERTDVPVAPMPIDLSNLPTSPVYLLVVGVFQRLLPGTSAVQGIWLFQALLGMATCYLAGDLARMVSGSRRAGLIAMLALAVSPAFVIETAQVTTETLYIFLVCAALWLYLRGYAGNRRAALLLAALLLGLATLTRAVFVGFPLGLAVHLLMVHGWRAGLKRLVVLLIVYALVVSTWTIYNRVHWNRWLIGAEGLSAFLYIGTTGWQGPTQTDSSLAEDMGLEGQLPSDPDEQQRLYQEAAAKAISRDPVGWLTRRATQLANAYLQPHGTAFFPGESLKDLLAAWFTDDRTPGGLLRITGGDQFWSKLIIYFFHYVALLAGLVGMWLARRNWHLTLPLIGFVVYTALVHLLLDAIPRYLFPTEIIWWVFAGVSLARLRLLARQPEPNLAQRGKGAVDEGVGVAQDSTRV